MTYVPPRIDLGDVVCNTGIADANGVQWFCSVPDGWDSPLQRGGTIDPSGRDGSVGLATFLSGRELIAKGIARATDSASAWDAYYTVMNLLPGVRGEMDFVVHEPTPKKLTVAQHGQPRADPPRWTYHFEFQLTLRADMPLKTGTTSTTTTVASGATVPLTNAGKAAAYPIVTATSGGTIDLVIGGRHFTTASVASGVHVDMWARTIRDGSGLDVSPWPKDPATEWLALPPGSTSVQQAGTAALEIVHYDTYA